MTRRHRLTASVSMIAMALSLVATPAKADLQGELDEMFGSMTTVAPAGYVNTQMRGAFAGGGAHMRNRIMDQNLVTFTPPSLEAGCGGINLYTGGFSFINKDQFVQLLRSVASNAMGLAFKAALSIISPQLEEKISDIQRIIQNLNEHMKDSCQLAQGIVDAGVDAYQGGLNQAAGNFASNLGFGDSAESLLPDTGGGNSLDKLRDTDPAALDENIKGNLVWRALKDHNAAAWFSHGDDELLEVMMNLTGTIIVSNVTSDSEGSTTEMMEFPSGNVQVRDLLEGGQFRIAGCDTTGSDGCLNPSTKVVTLRGLDAMVSETLIGSGATIGILDKLAANQPLTDAEKAFLAAQTDGIGGLLVQLAKRSPHAADMLARESAQHIALNMVTIMVSDMVRATQMASLTDDHPHVAALREKMVEARKAVWAEQDRLQAEIGPQTGLIDKYTALMGVIRKERLYLSGLSGS